jgi:hypothetical protein
MIVLTNLLALLAESSGQVWLAKGKGERPDRAVAVCKKDGRQQGVAVKRHPRFFNADLEKSEGAKGNYDGHLKYF